MTTVKLHLPNSRTVPVEVTPAEGRLAITGQNGIWLQLSAEGLADLLRIWAEQVEPSIIRAERQPDEFRSFSTIIQTDLDGKSPLEQIMLVIERFSNPKEADASGTLAGLVQDYKDLYKKLAGHSYDKRPSLIEDDIPLLEGLDQLELDLIELEPHLGSILVDGKANRSEIARVLNISPGGGNWPRLDAAGQALEGRAA